MNWSTLPHPLRADFGPALAAWRNAQPVPPLVGPPRGARRAGCSQAQLAAALGYKRNAVVRWERGEAPGEEARERLLALMAGGPEAVKRLASEQARRKFFQVS